MLLLFLLGSCSHYKDIPYFQNAAEYNGTGKAFLYDMTIKPKDMLTIFVYSSQPEAVVQFNFTEPRTINEEQQLDVTGVRIGRGGGQIHHYLVDNDGEIEFPIVGRIKLGGMTIEQANAAVSNKISPYIKEGADYTVNVKIDNYEVSVLGEVQRPNTFTVTRNKITVLEALALAGDLTIYGKRDNVKVLRERPDGEYEIHELDLRDIHILDSPYYYLQQRDIVYVEPNEVMAQNASIGR